MKEAIIDIGTNTFNLLIGTVVGNKIQVEFTTKEAVLLGMGGINEGTIAADAMQRAMETLSRFKDKCDELNVSSITGFGTSAMRASSNADELVNAAKDNLGIDIQIISGEDEANLIYKGVSLLHNFNEPGIIMDIGGGSIEYIHADASGVLKSGSFDIGVSRIYQQLGAPDEFTIETRTEIHAFLEKEAGSFFENLQVDTLLGASGSFETFFEMINAAEFVSKDAMVEIPIDKLNYWIEWALSSSLEERMANEWIVPMRKKMLPTAAYTIYWTMKKLGTRRVIISPYSLKEGAFLL